MGPNGDMTRKGLAVLEPSYEAVHRGIRFRRMWAMPSADTFDIPPIRDFVRYYLNTAKVSVDPFARNKGWATHTNDLNPKTSAKCHMEALDFLGTLANRESASRLDYF